MGFTVAGVPGMLYNEWELSCFRVSPGPVLGCAELLCQAVIFISRLAGESSLHHAHPSVLLCSPGVFRGGHDLLVRSRLVLTDTVTMQVTARSTEELPVDVIMASVG